MTIKMIVTDLDGTLLRTDKTISERTKTALNKCRNAGIKVAYATGRGGSEKKLVPSHMFDAMITMNGACGMIGDSAFYKRSIPYQTARPILMACHENGINITTQHNSRHYSNFIVSDYLPNIKDFEVVDFSRHELDAEKIYSPNPTPEQRRFIDRLLPGEIYSVATQDIAGPFLHIGHKEATKAKAISALAQLWDIAPAEIVAFGDDLNDIDMLSYVGTGVAMANALDEVKAVCKFTCPGNDSDGVAVWVEENILSPLL